jgi:lipopolysaccharide/colanic/teichoic acid biosynthesis glycosyltransferase
LLILRVRPGITDYASLEFLHLGDVLGNDDPARVYEERVRPIKNALRIKYVQGQSFTGALMIIFRTLRKLLGA